MTIYTVTFTIKTDADPSAILDAAHETGNDLLEHLEAMGIVDATLDEDETLVAPKED